MRWNLLAEVLEVSRGSKARTSAQWPVATQRPELLFLEMMAQTAGLIFGSLDDFQSDIVFAKVDKAYFQSVSPARSKLIIQAESEEIRPEGGWFQAQVMQANRRIAEARLLLANAGHLKPEISGSITFHQHFMNHYQVRQKVSPVGALP